MFVDQQVVVQGLNTNPYLHEESLCTQPPQSLLDLFLGMKLEPMSESTVF